MSKIKTARTLQNTAQVKQTNRKGQNFYGAKQLKMATTAIKTLV